MEWLIEKVVEIGVDRVVLLRCRRSERARPLVIDRLEKVAQEAMKKSLKTVVPIVEEISISGSTCEGAEDGAQKFFGYCDSAFPRKGFFRKPSSSPPRWS